MSQPGLHARIRELQHNCAPRRAVAVGGKGARKDGESFDLEVRGVPIQYQGGRTCCISAATSPRASVPRPAAGARGQLRQAQKMERSASRRRPSRTTSTTSCRACSANLVLRTGKRQGPGRREARAAISGARRLRRCGARDLIRQMLTFSRGQRGDRGRSSCPRCCRRSTRCCARRCDDDRPARQAEGRYPRCLPTGSGRAGAAQLVPSMRAMRWTERRIGVGLPDSYDTAARFMRLLPPARGRQVRRASPSAIRVRAYPRRFSSACSTRSIRPRRSARAAAWVVDRARHRARARRPCAVDPGWGRGRAVPRAASGRREPDAAEGAQPTAPGRGTLGLRVCAAGYCSPTTSR
jgi:hypothetical protein